MNAQLEIRTLTKSDPETISMAFKRIGWNKPAAQYRRYLDEQRAGTREVLVATIRGEFVGYITVDWQPNYAPFRNAGYPEIQDLNVLPQYRKRGIGTSLMSRVEALVSERSLTVGIGVGMYPDYGNAQRMYSKRGYVPDGRGLTYKCRILEPMAKTIVDDELVLYFTKTLN